MITTADEVLRLMRAEPLRLCHVAHGDTWELISPAGHMPPFGDYRVSADAAAAAIAGDALVDSPANARRSTENRIYLLK